MHNTITSIGEYRDALFYAFLIALIYIIWVIHNYLEFRKDQKATEKLFLTKAERDKLMTDTVYKLHHEDRTIPITHDNKL